MVKRAMIAMMLLAIPTMASAQGGGQRGGRGQRGPMAGAAQGPLTIVLEKKADLKLSDEQVVEIEAMQTALVEKYEPHLARMREMRETLKNIIQTMKCILYFVFLKLFPAYSLIKFINIYHIIPSIAFYNKIYV
jgi:hypothetical protein